jgi:proline iminopeptidase
MWGPNEFVVNGVLKDFDKTDVLKTISVPTLMIGGEYDEAPPETIKWYAQMIPESEVVIIPDASHMVMLEQPTIFNDTVRDFLHKVENRHFE